MSALDGPDKQAGLGFQPAVISHQRGSENHDYRPLEADIPEIIDTFFQIVIAGPSVHGTIPARR